MVAMIMVGVAGTQTAMIITTTALSIRTGSVALSPIDARELVENVEKDDIIVKVFVL